MGSFVYSPEIIVRVEGVDAKTREGTTYDVSQDITRASIDRRSTGVSTFNLTLSNRGRKYDGLFAPMDRVAIYLRRMGPPLLVLTGYLDSVPAFSTHSGPVNLRGSCTLKRLQHWYWDPQSEEGAAILGRQAGSDDPSEPEDNESLTDGGVSKRIVEVLTKVGQWNKNNIHIAAVPTEWFEDLQEISADLISEAERLSMLNAVGGAAFLGGTNDMTGQATMPGDGPGTGTLPGQIHTVSVFGGANGKGGMTELTNEPIRAPDDTRAQWGGEYYIAARWPYRPALGEPAPGIDLSRAKAWWKNRRILLVNPKTNKSVVVRAAHWGPPAGSPSSIQVSRAAYDAIGASPGSGVHMAFATESTPLGPLASGSDVINDPMVGGVVEDMGKYGRPPNTIGSTFAQLESLLEWATQQGYNVGEHPHYGGVTPGYHLSAAEGGFHWWPEGNPPGGAAADITWPAGGQAAQRKLDELAVEVCRRGLGCIWRSRGHWTHLHVDISLNRRMGALQYATLTGNKIPTPLGSPGNLGSGGYAPGATTGNIQQMGTALFGAFEYIRLPNISEQGQLLGGKRALMNDVPLYGTVDELMKAGLRDWCSAPNGDIIGWFPDYFGRFGTAAKMIIEPIEILSDGFTADWSDDRLKTHVFVTGPLSTTGGYLQGGMSASDIIQMSNTAGIASVEFPEMMKVLFNLESEQYSDKGKGFLSRFGARPEHIPMSNINGPHAEFFFAVYKFMQNWSNQYSARIGVAFLPEMYPGMIAVFPHYGVQAYVKGVRHDIDMSGGGFKTTLDLSSWSRIGNSSAALKGLPEGGPL